MRPRVLLALAWRDLLQVFRGRRGIGFVAITLLLLLPMVLLPRARTAAVTHQATSALRTHTVSGDVPPRVAELPTVRVVPPDQARTVFRRLPDGRLEVSGSIPPSLRGALDGGEPEVRMALTIVEVPVPKRTLLFALLSASVLMGSLTESLPGERSRRTLTSLLTAAITRGELVTGKFLAWAGYGVGAALASALAAVALGRAPLGWWLLPLAVVPACAVALGLFLVRRASDVVGGATISLRVLPALLGITGLGAWALGVDRPLLGAALPLGGALVAAGDTWPGLAPALVATASTGGATALLLWLTARDLEEEIRPEGRRPNRTLQTLALTAVLAPSVWVPLAGPSLWGPAGNPELGEQLTRAAGDVAVVAVLAVVLGVLLGRSAAPWRELVGTLRSPWAWAAVPVVAGVVWASSTWLHLPVGGSPLLAEAGAHVAAGLTPVELDAVGLLVAVTVQELLFRGVLTTRLGPVGSTAVFVLALSPLDPVGAVVIGGSLGALAWWGGVGPAVAARVLAVLPLALGAVSS